MTQRYTGGIGLGFIAALALLAAVVGGWLASVTPTTEKPWPPLSGLKKWVQARLFSIATAAVLVAGVYWKRYLDIPSWSLDSDLLPFLGAAYGAAFGALGTALAARTATTATATKQSQPGG